MPKADAQLETPVYYNVSFQISLWMNRGVGSMTVNLTDEAGKSCSSGAGGSNPTGIYTQTGALVTARLLPNKDYTVTVGGGISFIPPNAPCQYQGEIRFTSDHSIYLDGANCNLRTIAGTGIYSSSGGTYNFKVRVSLPGDYPLENAPNLRAGECSPLTADKPIWYVGLGNLRNGDSAGAVGFRRANFGSSAFFTPATLYYTPPDTSEVAVVQSSGVLRQVYSREVLIDIQTLTSTSYKMEIYARSQVTGYSGGLYTTSGSPFVTYTVEQITVSSGDGVKITRTEDGVTWETALELSNSIWTHRDWKVQGGSLSAYTTTNFTTTTAATVSHTGPNAANSGAETPYTWDKTYTDYSAYDADWGKELTQTIKGASETVPMVVESDYYTSTGSGGAFIRKLKHVISTDGSWTKYIYNNAAVSTGSAGSLQRIFRPWKDSASIPSSASTSNSVYEDYEYDSVNPLLTTKIATYAPGGTLLKKSTWAYNHNASTLNGMTVMSATRDDYYSSASKLTTVTKTFQYGIPTVSFRNRLVSVSHPDGRKDSVAYFNGTWNNSTKAFTASSGGDDRLVLTFHGQTSGGTSISAWTLNSVAWNMDSVQMVVNRSTVSERVIDVTGRVVFEGENVYTSSSTMDRISGLLYRYDSHGRLTDTVDVVRSGGSNEFKSQRTYGGGLLATKTGTDGVVVKQEYDSLLRVIRRTSGYGGSSPYPAKITEYLYDGANRVVTTYPCSCGTSPTDYVYDTASRLSSQSDPSPNGGSLITSYTYSSLRTTTKTLPTGVTQTTTTYLDGRPKSVSGTAQAPSEWDYSYNSTGVKVTQQNGSTTADGWTETQTDLLGRVVLQSKPTWNWATSSTNILDSEFEYNSSGQLWRERLKYRAISAYLSADRIRTYDAAGRQVWDGFDVDNSGTLTSNSNDRINELSQSFTTDSAGWLSVTTNSTYATLNSSSATQLSHLSTRLTGFGNSTLGTYGYNTEDIVTLNTTGRSTHRMDFVDPSQRKRRTESQVQGGSNWAYSQSINGYPSEELSQTGVLSAYEYDSLGRVQYYRTRWSGSAFAETTAYAYHSNTAYVSSVTVNGTASSYSYGWASPSGTRKVSITDASGYVTHTLYNEKDLPWRVWGDATNPAESGYDTLGRRTSLSTWRSGSFTGSSWPSSPGSGDTTTWNLEAATGLLTRKTFADGRHVDYTYTAMGQLATRTWARGVVATYTYYDGSTTSSSSVSHRTQELRGVSYSDGTPLLGYTYLRTGANDTVTDVTGTRSFTYRSDLQLDYESLPSGFYGSARTLRASYETGSGGTVAGRANGYAFATSGSDEASNIFTFNGTSGRIDTVTGQNLPTFTMGYTTGSDWNQTVTTGNYSRMQTLHSSQAMLKRVQTNWSGTTKGDYDSAFDARGYRSSQTASGTVPGTTRTDDYTYNTRSEITASNDSSSSVRSFAWSYDLFGNRQGQTGGGGGSLSYTPDSLNQYSAITGETGLSYDYDGNLTADGLWTYLFDGENRLVEMSRKDGTQTLQFSHDYAGRRVQKTVRAGGSGATVSSSIKFVWSGWRLLAELDAGTGMTGSMLSKSYLWGTDFSGGSGAGGLLTVRQASTNYLPVYDAMGSVTGYLDGSSGVVVAAYDYSAYGDVIQQSGSSSSFAFGHATQYTDRESGLVYYGFRYYNPKHGRFINRDPISEFGGLNIHAFLSNNPLNKWEVLGLYENEFEGFKGRGSKYKANNGTVYDFGETPNNGDVYKFGGSTYTVTTTSNDGVVLRPVSILPEIEVAGSRVFQGYQGEFNQAQDRSYSAPNSAGGTSMADAATTSTPRSGPLSWSNFKGDVPSDPKYSKFGAFISTGIRVDWAGINQTKIGPDLYRLSFLNPTTRGVMNENLSWVRPSELEKANGGARLLTHETIHFLITSQSAAALLPSIQQLSLTSDSENLSRAQQILIVQAEGLRSTAEAVARGQNATYDLRTNHGANQAAQNSYNKQFGLGGP